VLISATRIHHKLGKKNKEINLIHSFHEVHELKHSEDVISACFICENYSTDFY